MMGLLKVVGFPISADLRGEFGCVIEVEAEALGAFIAWVPAEVLSKEVLMTLRLHNDTPIELDWTDVPGEILFLGTRMKVGGWIIGRTLH